MKKFMLPALAQLAFVFAISSVSQSAFAGKDHDHKPQHGGVVTSVKEIDFELLAKPSGLELFVREAGKPVDVKRLKASVTVLVGKETQVVELAPAASGTNGLNGLNSLSGKAKLDSKAGVKAIAQISVDNKPYAVRFNLAQ